MTCTILMQMNNLMVKCEGECLNIGDWCCDEKSIMKAIIRHMFLGNGVYQLDIMLINSLVC